MPGLSKALREFEFVAGVKFVTHIISLFNQSGGVGKSTLTMNLGYHLTQMNYQVLLVDMDPQGSLTTFMGLQPNELESTVYDAVVSRQPVPIYQKIHGMDLAPANIDLSGAELELVVADMRDFRLRNALNSLKADYDFILIDCPPSLGILSYISLVAATHVLIPIQTEYKALRGTELLLQTVRRVLLGANNQLKIAGVIPTMYKSATNQSKNSFQAIQNQLSKIGTIFAPIPETVVFPDAAQEHLPVAEYDAKHSVVKVLKQAAQRISEL